MGPPPLGTIADIGFVPTAAGGAAAPPDFFDTDDIYRKDIRHASHRAGSEVYADTPGMPFLHPSQFAYGSKRPLSSGPIGWRSGFGFLAKILYFKSLGFSGRRFALSDNFIDKGDCFGRKTFLQRFVRTHGIFSPLTELVWTPPDAFRRRCGNQPERKHLVGVASAGACGASHARSSVTPSVGLVQSITASPRLVSRYPTVRGDASGSRPPASHPRLAGEETFEPLPLPIPISPEFLDERVAAGERIRDGSQMKLQVL